MPFKGHRAPNCNVCCLTSFWLHRERVVMSSGLCKEGGPAILQVHRKAGQTCLLMPWDTMFSEEQQEQWRKRERRGIEERESDREREQRRERGRRSRSEWVWWPHVPSVAQCSVIAGLGFVLNIHREAENKPCPNTGAGWWSGEARPQTRPSVSHRQPPPPPPPDPSVSAPPGTNRDSEPRPGLLTLGSKPQDPQLQPI